MINHYFSHHKTFYFKIQSIPLNETLSIDGQQTEEEKIKTPDAIPTVKLDGKNKYKF